MKHVLNRLGRRTGLISTPSVGEEWADFDGTDSERLNAYRSSCSWPDLYYAKTLALARLVQPRLVVEVGVAFGYHAEFLLSQLGAIEYIGVDPYLAGYDKTDPFVADVANLFQASPETALDRLYDAVASRLTSTFPGRATLYRETSHEASLRFSDSSIDFVFIDGDHRFDAVVRDLKDWWPKVGPGGVLVGDDYDWQSVRDAVDRFALSRGLRVLLVGEPNTEHISYLLLNESDHVDL